MSESMERVDEGWKQCPFCGSVKTVEIDTRKTFEELQSKSGYAVLGARCAACNVEMYEHSHSENDYSKRRERLRRMWNTRNGWLNEITE